MARKLKNTTGIPDFEIESLARAFAPAILDFFRTEEGRREFEEWKAKRQLNNKNLNKESR